MLHEIGKTYPLSRSWVHNGKPACKSFLIWWIKTVSSYCFLLSNNDQIKTLKDRDLGFGSRRTYCHLDWVAISDAMGVV